MATLALAAAGAAAGSALLPTGFSVLGATLSGAAIGSQIGALAGSYVDQALFGGSGQSSARSGPRLSDLRVTSSTEGAAVPRIYGRARVGGQIIWASDFDEQVITTEAGGSGKGGGQGGGAATQTDYRYFANFAVALAEGEISGLGRVWADGTELDLAGLTWRLHSGSESQFADSLIVSRLGADAPAYRGIAYVVFEGMPLAPYGNRLPQLSFEVFRNSDTLRSLVRGVVLIPGSGEFVMATGPVTRVGFGGERLSENVHTKSGASDAVVAVDQLRELLPAVAAVSLVTTWFGNDLRCGTCQIQPRVERSSKDTSPLAWSVAGLPRSAAPVVSQREGRPAYGGTPSDTTVVDQIAALRARGLSVTLNPFILMDVPAENTLANPHDGAATQPAYPWRGRITCDPAPGRPATPDKTPAAAAQIANFVGTALPGHFALAGAAVVYSGPAEWSYRRFILHHAWLAKAAGGVDAFLIGSELRGLSTVRSAAAVYPFVAALQQLAVDVKSILGPAVKVTYAADWSEYFGHQPVDGTGDVYFHLDALWASAAIDAIGIDLYWPLADWRDGGEHLDALAGARSTYDLAYLKDNITGGEGFDWYYADDAARSSQTRTPVADGTGKPWVFRYKDLKSWWINQHFHRPGGVEQATPTAWVPQSKPFWLMEAGCSAVDKGANQPNVFVDPKSAESSLPWFSSGRRDDFMQRRYVQALLEAFEPGHPGSVAGLNAISTVYGGPMVATDRTHIYAWDLRPHPAFPNDRETWSDGSNWRLGHWLNGRMASVALDDLVAQLMSDYGFAAFDAAGLDGVVQGYVIDRIMAPREALQPLELAYFFDSLESGGRIALRHRGAAASVATIGEQDCVETKPGAALVTLTRGQETELPASAKITHLSPENDYRQAVAEARRLSGASGRVAQADLALLLDSDAATELAEAWLFEAWAARERASFSLPPSRLAVEPGDSVVMAVGGRSRVLRVTEVGEHGARDIEARGIDAEVYQRTTGPVRLTGATAPSSAGQADVYFLDLPKLRGDEPDFAGYVSAAQSPWPGPLAVYRSPETTGYQLAGYINAPGVHGLTLTALPAAPEGRVDHATSLRVQVGSGGALSSVSRLKLLDGANAAAVRNANGDWEVLQFETAELIGSHTYALSRLLRGQAGSELAMANAAPVPAGAPFVVIGAGLTKIDLTVDQLALPYNWRVGPAAKDLGAPDYVAAVYAYRSLGARPLSPVHVRGQRNAAGDINVTWIRRTRSGGDSWTVAEVPLGETVEAYEVDILSGGTIIRSLSVPQPAMSYPAAAQILDFGALQASVTLRVHQLSSVWGRGAGRTAAV